MLQIPHYFSFYQLRVNSKSYNAGLLEGDVIMACNDENLRLASHHLAMRMIERAGDNLTLTVLRLVILIPGVSICFL